MILFCDTKGYFFGQKMTDAYLIKQLYQQAILYA